MAEYMYSAWLRDEKFPPDDEDYEWVAMYIVIAESSEIAIAWGDHLAKKQAALRGEPFIRSYVESPAVYAACIDFDRTPRVVAGDDSVDPFANE